MSRVWLDDTGAERLPSRTIDSGPWVDPSEVILKGLTKAEQGYSEANIFELPSLRRFGAKILMRSGSVNDPRLDIDARAREEEPVIIAAPELPLRHIGRFF